MYELERERDVQAAAMQATQDAMEKVRKRALDLERRNGELERSIATQKTDHGRLTMENASLQADVQQLQKRLTENLKKMSSMAQGDPSVEASVPLSSRETAASASAICCSSALPASYFWQSSARPAEFSSSSRGSAVGRTSRAGCKATCGTRAKEGVSG